MSEYKLVYFDARARAEPARYLLAAGEAKWTDEIVDFATFGEKKATYPFGSLPILVVDGKHVLSQHIPICRYLGNQFGFVGKNNLENALADMYAEGANDLWKEIPKYNLTLIREPNNTEKLAEAKKNFLAVFKDFCVRYENFLQGPWFTSEKPTWADAYIAEWLYRVKTCLDEHCLDQFPKLKDFCHRFHELPRIKKYLSTAKPRPL